MTTAFEYDVEEPDAKANSPMRRGQGQVVATKGKEPAGYLIFGLGPGEDVISLTRIETFERFRLQGCAEGMIDKLQAHYPLGGIEDGGSSNTEDGEKLLARLRAKGKVKPAKPSVARTGEYDFDLYDAWLEGFPADEHVAVQKYAKWDETQEQWVDNRPTAEG